MNTESFITLEGFFLALWSVSWSVRHTYRCSLFGPSQGVCRPYYVIYFLKAMTNTKTFREHLQRAILETCVFTNCIFQKYIFPNIINLTGPIENCLKKWSCLLFQNTIFTEPARTLILLVIVVCKMTCNIISIRLDWGRVSIQYNLVGEIFDGVTNFAMEIPCRG